MGISKVQQEEASGKRAWANELVDRLPVDERSAQAVALRALILCGAERARAAARDLVSTELEQALAGALWAACDAQARKALIDASQIGHLEAWMLQQALSRVAGEVAVRHGRADLVRGFVAASTICEAARA